MNIEISNTPLHMNPLWRSLMDVADYFARLGGSARFDGFHEWYSPSLVLMCWLELNASPELINRVKSDSYLPEKLWTQTYGLADDVRSKLSQAAISNQDIEQFITEVSKRVGKNTGPRSELQPWLQFIELFKMASKA